MDTYDVIVIGAGNGGLMAGATTAQKGLKTLILEQHNLPGGCATSFRRGRFEFEPSLHELAGGGPPDAPGDVRQLFDSLGVQVEMLPVGDAFRTIVTGPNGYDVTMPSGVPEFVTAMERQVPGSAPSVSAFFQLAGAGARALGYLGQGAPDPAVLMQDHLDFMKVANQPVGTVLDALGMPQRAQDILCTYWPYMGTPRSQFAFLLYSLMTYRYIAMAPYIPAHRSYDMSLAIEQRYRELGGEAWYNTRAARLLMDNGRCTGVVTADGRELRARAVIADISPNAVYGAMMDPAAVPPNAAKLANARTPGFSALGVYLGLDQPPEALGITDYSVFIAETADSDEEYRRMHTLDENDFLIMNCLNIVNPQCSPPSTSLLWATQLYAPETFADVTPQEYKALKNRLAAAAIDRYEAATGVRIRDHIEEISVATPATFARYLATPGGSIYGTTAGSGTPCCPARWPWPRST